LLKGAFFANTRLVADLTFAFNQWLSGPEVFSYHMVNLIIHIGTAFLVYQLLFQIISFCGDRNALQHSSSNGTTKNAFPRLDDLHFWPAFFGGLLFLIHPLATQSVTYITQRYTSLATLFYTASIVFFLKARRITSDRQQQSDMSDSKLLFAEPYHLCWYLLSVLMAVLAMYSKEMSLTLPAMLILVEFLFVQPNLKNVGKRSLYLLPLLATGLIIPYWHLPAFHGPQATADVVRILPLLDGPQATANVIKILPSWGQHNLTRSTYFFSQLGIIWNTYLKLLVFPHGLSIEHDFFVSNSLLQPITFAACLGLLSLAIIAVATLKNHRLVAFSLIWFFVTISVTSSFIPNNIFVAEHRVYLPMIGLSFLTAGIYRYWKKPRLFWSIAIPLVILLSTASLMRNLIWKNDVTLWRDALTKAPGLSRPYNNYAVALTHARRFDEAIAAYQKVLVMPNEPFKRGDMEKLLAMHNIARVYADKGMYQEALRRYQALIGLFEEKTMIDPFSQATIYLGTGGKKTVIDPFSLAAVYLAMGNVFADAKQYDRALGAYQKSLELIPHNDKRLRSHALTNLGWLLSLLGRDDKAEIALKKAVKCNPKAARAYLQLGNLYSSYPPRKAETVACYKRYLALESHSPFRQELLAKIEELEQEMISGDLAEDTHERIRRASLSLIEPEQDNLNDYDPP
jgi:tetratricopeptide (TPR) repeat protein